MERLIQSVTETPVFTLGYMVAVAVTSTATSVGAISPSLVVFTPKKAFGHEWWRLFSSFFYFGDLNFNLLIHLYFIRRSLGQLESNYKTRITHFPLRWRINMSSEEKTAIDRKFEKFQSIDFLYYVFLMCCSIIALVTFGFYYRDIKVVYLGPIFDDVMVYVFCKQNPNADLLLFIFTIKASYFPYVYAWINWCLSGEFGNDIMHFKTSTTTGLLHMLKLKFLWQMFVCYSVGHVWWYLKDVWMDKGNTEYKDMNIKAREGISGDWLTKMLTLQWSDLVYLVTLSPVYWVMPTPRPQDNAEAEAPEVPAVPEVEVEQDEI